MRVRAKICGLTRPADARIAAEAGADYLGVVLTSGPRRRDAEQALGIWDGLDTTRVGVFVGGREAEVIEVARTLRLGVVQLHGKEGPDVCRRVGAAGDWAVWKAIRVGMDSSLAAQTAPFVGAVGGLLLEGESARGHGGVGARFDWGRAARLKEDWPGDLQLILAGGLGPENVAEAIEAVRPDVVDVSSGVEIVPGVKDAERVRSFIRVVEQAGD